MSETLAELSLLCTDAIKKGIIDTIIKESPIMRRLPWMTIDSNNLLYNLEQTLVGGEWVTVGDLLNESTPDFAQRTAKLYELIGNADVDNFMKATRKDQNIEAAVIEKKTKGMVYDFEEACLYGGTSTAAKFLSAKCMTGLLLMLAQCETAAGTVTDLDGLNNPQVVPASATSGVLTLDMMDQLRDTIKPGKPDAYIMSRRLRRKMEALARAAGNNLEHDNSQAGMEITHWGGVEILINDFIYDNIQDGASSVLTLTSYDYTHARAAGYDNSIILALKFGEDAVCGLKNGELPQTEYFPKLETKNAARTRLIMYPGLANFAPSKLAGLINVQDVAL
jgi:HK97 family phage major capsid protein